MFYAFDTYIRTGIVPFLFQGSAVLRGKWKRTYTMHVRTGFRTFYSEVRMYVRIIIKYST